jgi:F-type H+-transporting ATPase subunit b
MQLDWVTFGLEIVNFFVLVWILQHFLYKPILATIARRKAVIEKALAEARDRHGEAEALERKYQQRVAEWEHQKEGLRSAALAAVDEERKRRMVALQTEIDRESERRRAVERRQDEEQRRKAQESARRQAGRMAAALLERLASPAVEQRLVAVMLEDLEQLDAERRDGLADACRRADGRLRVESAFPIADAERSRIGAALERVTGRSVTPEFVQDPELLAGLRVTAGSLVLHANVADELGFLMETAGVA